MEMLERVGKETMELIIDETGMEVEKDTGEGDQQTEEEPFEEVSFDRCFYIYGGPDQLEVRLLFLHSFHAIEFQLLHFYPYICDLFHTRSWKHCQATMRWYLIGKSQNLLRSRKHIMMERLKKYNRF
jgi:hypothetical protein